MATKSSWPMIEVEEAMKCVLSFASMLLGSTREDEAKRVESIDLYRETMCTLSSRVLAEDVRSSEPHPRFAASIMDGYAVVSSDGIGVFPIIDSAFAGKDSSPMQVKSGQVAYITTGAALPPGTDAVVKVEDTDPPSVHWDGTTTVRIKVSSTPGKYVRTIGSDIQSDVVVLAKGTLLTPADVGLLATVDVSRVSVYRRPVVGVLSTGDELVDPGVKLSGAMIRDSNRFMLLSAAANSGADVIDLGIAVDKQKPLERIVKEALKKVDILVTSGGVSMGSLDLVKPLLESLGRVHFGRVRLKPGKPTTFATVQDTLVFALPGNPVSSLVTFQVFVEPAIRRLQGLSISECALPCVQSRLAHPMRADPVRREYHRVVLEWRGNVGGAGEFLATSTGMQRSSRLLSMRGANALVCIPRGRGIVPAGAVLPTFLLRHGAFTLPKTVEPHVTIRSCATIVAPQSDEKENKTQDEGASACPCCRAAGKGKKIPDALELPPPFEGGSVLKGTQLVRVGVLTVSDRASQGKYTDRGGPEILRCIWDHIKSLWVSECRVVPDDRRTIEAALCDLCDRTNCHLIITTGGTGCSRRDVTPEATTHVCDRLFPGFGEKMRSISLRYVPTAILSRQVAGMRGSTMIVNLPGNPSSIRQILPEILQVIAHGLVLSGGPTMEVRNDGPSSTSESTIRTWTVDKVNLDWLNHLSLAKRKGGNLTEIVTEVLKYAGEYHDQSYVFEKKRGMGRKKNKVDIKLTLSVAQLAYLDSSVLKFKIPSTEKALRIVLDFALEERDSRTAVLNRLGVQKGVLNLL